GCRVVGRDRAVCAGEDPVPIAGRHSDRAKANYQYLLDNNRLWGKKAQALGWRAPSKENEEKYLKSEAKNKFVN
ncbi:MAG: hypothetical protein ACJ8LN_12285, partial [Sulfurifustis sp.]